ncbi:MAG TPA: EAL domain-containing protein [Dehalococcoidia bacterium]
MNATFVRKPVPFWARPVFLVLAIFAVLVAAAGAIRVVHDYSERQYRDAQLMQDLQLYAYDLMSAGWRAALGNSPPPAGVDPAAAAVEAKASIEFLEATLQTYDDTYAGRGPFEVRALLAGYVSLNRQELDLLREGRAFDAFGVAVSALASFATFRSAAQEASAGYTADATRVGEIAEWGSVAAVAFAVVAMSLLYWRFRVVQRRVEKADAEQEILRRSEARFRPLVQSSSDVIAVVDEAGVFTYASPAIDRVAGLLPQHAVGTCVFDLVEESHRRHFESFLAEINARPGYTASIELQLRPRHGELESPYFQVVGTNRLSDPDVGGFVLNMRDISERKALEEQLRHQAFHDSLTNLSNRARFMDRLEHALSRGKRAGDQQLSVLYMDLDYFKNVNDELGHSAGDLLLRHVAERLAVCIRSADTAARLGGDEFAILLDDATSAREARAVADRILAEMAKPFNIGGNEINLSASIGLVFANPQTTTAEEIIRDADVAMYDAKENGRGRVQLFEPGMQISLLERLHLISELNAAVERDEFLVYYQPTLDLASERITGFEALVRWDHPMRGLLPPSEFIGIAEETGAILALGQMVLDRACRQAKEWQERYPSMRGISMSVNVSAKQIQRPGFVEVVQRALEESRLDPKLLVLEITETVLVAQPQRVIETLQQIKRLGVLVALDDFGTGYSSLSYLQGFPIDILKIDRAFIQGIDSGEKDRMLVQTVIDLANVFDLEIVAEGIERQEQLTRLRDLHCARGQGYLFARPLDPAAADAFLRRLAGEEPASAEAVA